MGPYPLMHNFYKRSFWVLALALCLCGARTDLAFAHASAPRPLLYARPGSSNNAGPDAHLYRISDASSVSEYNRSIYSDPPPSLGYGGYRQPYVAPPAPPPTYLDQGARTYCRRYSRQTRAFGRMKESYGVACLQPDGAWRAKR